MHGFPCGNLRRGNSLDIPTSQKQRTTPKYQQPHVKRSTGVAAVNTLIRNLIVSILTIPLWLAASQSFAVQITHVSHEPLLFDPQHDESALIRFRTSDRAQVMVKLYDGRDLLIRALGNKQVLTAGDHEIRWDGKDQAGNPVPPEAYHYTIEATGTDSQNTVFDLTDLTGGSAIEPESVQWDAASKYIQYVLRKPARINIRIGLDNNGPLLRTMYNWVPRMPGVRKERWDGMDQSGVLDLSAHPRRYIKVLAYELSENTIIVGPDPGEVKLIENLPWGKKKRESKRKQAKRMYQHSQQPIETRRDVTIHLILPHGLAKTAEGIPILTGTVPVRLDVAQQDRALVVNRRHEPAFFIDGSFAWENEVGFLPMTWMLNTESINEGAHYVTANLLGYEGNFGVATIKIMVKH